MIIATRITLLVFTVMFYLSALGAKEERHRYMSLIAGVLVTTLLLFSLRVI